MCMDFQIPKKSTAVIKRFPLESRINDILTPFVFERPKHFDDKDGLSQDEFDSIYERAVIKAMKQHSQSDTPSGGKIKDPPRRIRKKKPQD